MSFYSFTKRIIWVSTWSLIDINIRHQESSTLLTEQPKTRNKYIKINENCLKRATSWLTNRWFPKISVINKIGMQHFVFFFFLPKSLFNFHVTYHVVVFIIIVFFFFLSSELARLIKVVKQISKPPLDSIRMPANNIHKTPSTHTTRWTCELLLISEANWYEWWFLWHKCERSVNACDLLFFFFLLCSVCRCIIFSLGQQ